MKAAIFFGLTLLLAATVGRGQAVSSDADTPVAKVADPAEATVPMPIDPNYLLQPDDIIEVVVFREPDLTTNAIVRKDGEFEMKLLGAVKVAGLSVDQATEAIRCGLAKDYLVSPRVSLSIVSYAKKKINVLGEVRTPGLYGFPEHGTLMLSDAIAMAGGFLASADTAHIVVRRTSGEKAETIQVDASGDDSTETDKFEVQPDDAITVALLPKRHFTVLGQVNRPGTYDVADNRPVYLTDAVALAGGFTRLANASGVMVKRVQDGHEIVMKMNARAMENSPDTQRMLIANEDTITVPETMF